MTDPIPFYLAPQEYNPAMPLDELHEHPKNYNVGADEALAASLDAHGFYGAVMVQRSTGLIIAGNSRYRGAAAKGAPTLPAFLLDITDDEAEAILANDNLFGKLAVFDEAALVALLSGYKERTGTLGPTGYGEDQLADMIALLTAPGLDELPDGDDPGDTWPAVTIRAPHVVIAAWNDRVKNDYDGNAAVAFAALLGVQVPT